MEGGATGWSVVAVCSVALLLIQCASAVDQVDFAMSVVGRGTLYRGSTNEGPEERMYYTMAHLSVNGMQLSVDSGSRWPWAYVVVRSYEPSSSRNSVHVNNSRVMFKYGAGFFSSDPAISDVSGYYSDVLDFQLANSSMLPVQLHSFVGINKVLMNTPVLGVLNSGIIGCGPPCFQANDTDTPCEPCFLKQVTGQLGTDERFTYALQTDSSAIASGVLSLGSRPPPANLWVPLAAEAFSQGLWYVNVEYSVGDGEFTSCLALVDTGGGPTYLPIGDTWTFGRNCTGIDQLPTYSFRLPDTGDVLAMTPDDYVIRVWNDDTSSFTCESATLFASSTASEEYGHARGDGFRHWRDPTTDGSTPFCVVGMWTATKFPLSFQWTKGLEAVGFTLQG